MYNVRVANDHYDKKKQKKKITINKLPIYQKKKRIDIHELNLIIYRPEIHEISCY